MKSRLMRALTAAIFMAATTLTGLAHNVNAYAYEIKVDQSMNRPRLTYKLNAPAAKVVVRAFVDGKLYQQLEGPTEQSSGTGSPHAVTFNFGNLENVRVNFDVQVTSKYAPSGWNNLSVAGTTYVDGYPFGLAVNPCPDSPYFGHVYTVETRGGCLNRNVNIYYPELINTHTVQKKFFGSDVYRIKINKDGILYGTCIYTYSRTLYSTDAVNFEGMEVLNSSSNGYGGGGLGLDIWGEGDDFKVAVVHGSNMQNTGRNPNVLGSFGDVATGFYGGNQWAPWGDNSSNNKGYYEKYDKMAAIYHLGKDRAWGTKSYPKSPQGSDSQESFSKNFQRNGMVNILFDPDGKGVSMYGYTANGSWTDRNFSHSAIDDQLSSNWNGWDDGRASIFNNVQAAIWAPDGKHLILANNTVIKVYEADFSDGQVKSFNTNPVGTLTVNDGAILNGRGITVFEFDPAGNLYYADQAHNHVGVIATPMANPVTTTPAPANTAYTITRPSQGSDGRVALTDLKSYDGRNTASIYWEYTANSVGNKPYNFELLRDGQVVTDSYNGLSFIDQDIPDGQHNYIVRAYYYTGKDNTGTQYYVESAPKQLDQAVRRDPGMTNYRLEEVYNYPIATPDEINEYGLSKSKTFPCEGRFANMRTKVGAYGAPGDAYRQGVFRDGKWYIAQLTNETSDTYINNYGTVTDNNGGIVTVDGDNPLEQTQWARIKYYPSLLNQSIAMPDKGTTFFFRANQKDGAADGCRRYMDATGTIAVIQDLSTKDNNAVLLSTGSWDFRDLSGKNDSHNPNSHTIKYSWGMDDQEINKGEILKDIKQYYRNQYLVADGDITQKYGARLFVPMNMSRDIYVGVLDVDGRWTSQSKKFSAPTDLPSYLPGTENFAVPIKGRKDFLHVMRSNAVYYVNWDSGLYTPILTKESEANSASGYTFSYNGELFYVHGLSLLSNNTGHFRIDMPSRTWDAEGHKYSNTWESSDFTKLVPIAMYTQAETEGSNFKAGNSNGVFFGSQPGKKVVKGEEIDVIYIYQYVPGVRFAKYVFYPENTFPPVNPSLSVDLNTTATSTGKDADYEHMDKYVVNYNFYPNAYEFAQGVNWKRHHYNWALYGPDGTIVKDKDNNEVKGTFTYDPTNPDAFLEGVYEGPDGNGVGCNEQYTIKVNPVYQDTSDETKFKEVPQEEAIGKKGYEPGVRDLQVTAYKDETYRNHDGTKGLYRYDLDFDRAPRNNVEQAADLYGQDGHGASVVAPEPVTKFIIELDREGNGKFEPCEDIIIMMNGKQYSSANQPQFGDHAEGYIHNGYIPGDYDFGTATGNGSTGDRSHGNTTASATDNDPVVASFMTTKPLPATAQFRVTAIYADNNDRIRRTASTQGLAPVDFIPTGVDDIAIDNAADAPSLTAFPVPATDVVTLRSTAAINTVKIMNMSGAVVKALDAEGSTTITVNISDLSAGVYVMVVNDNATVRIIKKQ